MHQSSAKMEKANITLTFIIQENLDDQSADILISKEKLMYVGQIFLNADISTARVTRVIARKYSTMKPNAM